MLKYILRVFSSSLGKRILLKAVRNLVFTAVYAGLNNKVGLNINFMSIVLTGVAAQVVWHERLGFGKDCKGNLVIVMQPPRYVQD